MPKFCCIKHYKETLIYSQFPQQILVTLFSPAFSTASRIKSFCSNINFEPGFHTGNIWHKNLGLTNNVKIIKFNSALTRRCGLFTAVPKTIQPLYCNVVFT